MQSLHDKLRKRGFIAIYLRTDERGVLSEFAAVREMNFHEKDALHAFIEPNLPDGRDPVERASDPEMREELAFIKKYSPAVQPRIFPSEQEALIALAAFAEGHTLAAYGEDVFSTLVSRGAVYGIAFPLGRVDGLALARRIFYKEVSDFSFETVITETSCSRKWIEAQTDCLYNARAFLNLLRFTASIQQNRFRDFPYYRIETTRRKIRSELWQATGSISYNLFRCALFGENHPLFPLWLYKCAEKLEYVSRFVDNKGRKLPQDRYESLFTAHFGELWEVQDALKGEYSKEYGDYTYSEELAERVFAIYDAVRVSCMPYLMHPAETYHPDEYATIILQAIRTERKVRDIKIDYNDKAAYKLYNDD